VHRHDHPQVRVDVLELLAGQAEADVVHAGAAVLGRHRDAEQAELGIWSEGALEAVFAVELLNAGSDLARAPLPDRRSSRWCSSVSRINHDGLAS